ncbi:SpoIIE family protein phosphatase [Saccharothrix sp. NPDC042600]|uniref:SpoIIE family protein phosphatase n=1 Tax=Saccharothrix TaxID=2071 RepID=UPI0033E46658|nr:SpoIIE family protein phosphatase [Saccharothrix mutabilis subsp. capreolus]
MTVGDVTSDSSDLPDLVDDLGVVAWEADVATRRFTFVSRYAEVLLGYPLDRWFDGLDSLTELVEPVDREEVLRAWRAGVAQDYFEVEFRVVAADGRTMWLRCRGKVVCDDRGRPVRARGMLADVTRRRDAEQHDRFLADLEQRLQRLGDAEQVMAVVTRLLREHLAADRCAYARVEADEDHFVMSGDHATGLPSLRGRFAMSAFGEDALRTMRAGRPWIVADAAHDPRLTGDDRDTYQRTGIRAVVTVPLLRDGRFVAGLAVHQASVRHWTPSEVELVSVVVGRCWESLQRVHADRALRESEQRHRLLVEQATDAIWILDRDSRFVEVNPAACALLGRTRDELLGTSVTDVVVSGRDPGAPGQDAHPAVGRVITEVWQVRRGDGTVIALELSIQTTPTGTQAIGRDVTERQRAEAEREALLRREHEIAEALQRSLLPGELPSLDRLAIAARYLPASTYAQIGGDWYDVLELDAAAVALCVGDVVGKGPSAAAVMGQLRTALAGYLLDGHSPAAALERLDLFSRRVNGATGSTCVCLVFDRATGALRWSAAGHPPPLVVDAGTARSLTGGGGAVLGAAGRPRYVEHSAALPVGASVVLYTDGLVERHDTTVDEGLARLLAVAGDVSGAAPHALADAVTDALLADGQSDDVALVIARHLPAPLRTTLPAQPASLAVMRREVAAWASAAGLSADLLGDLQLALGEAAANVVDHAYGPGTGSLEYELAARDAGVHVIVRDHGRWRPVPADPGHRGRGMQIIRALAEEVAFDQREDGTTVDFHLAPETGAPPPPASAAPIEGEGARLPADDQGGSTVRVRLVGELDTATVERLRASVLHKVGDADDRVVEVDLTEVTYLSSSGIALLLDAAAAVHTGHTLTVLVTEGSAPDRVLSLSGLHGLDPAGPLVVRRT